MEKKVVKLGVVGLKRGGYVAGTIIGDDNVVITAIADKDPVSLKETKESYEKKGAKDFLCFVGICACCCDIVTMVHQPSDNMLSYKTSSSGD